MKRYKQSLTDMLRVVTEPIPSHVLPPNHLLCDFGPTDQNLESKKLSSAIKHFWSWWQKKYLCNLRQTHNSYITNYQNKRYSYSPCGKSALSIMETRRFNWMNTWRMNEWIPNKDVQYMFIKTNAFITRSIKS